jgi:hypothetical protein
VKEYQKEVDDKIKKDLNFLSTRLEQTDIKNRYKEALKIIEELKLKLKILKDLQEAPEDYSIIESASKLSEATAIILASDWHIEEIVKPKKVSFLNEFNLTIGEKRANLFFQNSAKLINGFKRDIKIDNIVLALLGDFISSNIHEELLENTCLRPMEAIRQVQMYLIAGIKYLLNKTTCTLVIPCQCGNHGRITDQIHISNEQENSLETLMYYTLSLYFRNYKRVKFIVGEAEHLYMDVYGYKLRLHHGTNIKYQRGVGGLTVPANRIIAQWNIGINAYLDLFGHLHTRLDNGNFLANGSLIGYNAYAISKGIPFSKPCQTLFLLDKDRGKTIVAPIFLE